MSNELPNGWNNLGETFSICKGHDHLIHNKLVHELPCILFVAVKKADPVVDGQKHNNKRIKAMKFPARHVYK